MFGCISGNAGQIENIEIADVAMWAHYLERYEVHKLIGITSNCTSLTLKREINMTKCASASDV